MSTINQHSATRLPGERCLVGESPLWNEQEQCLYFVDILGKKLVRLDPVTGKQDVFTTPEHPGNTAPRRAGGVYIAMQTALWSFDPVSEQFDKVQDTPYVPARYRFNDGISDGLGRMIAGTMGMDADRGFKGVLYSLAPDQSARVLMEGFNTINGLALSNDQKTLYVAETNPEVATVWRCPYELSSGTTGPREVFVDLREYGARPDGACMDNRGGYWVAATDIGEVLRFDANRTLTDRVDIGPRRVGKPAFGGRALDQMYITTLSVMDEQDPRSGHLFHACVGATGTVTIPWD